MDTQRYQNLLQDKKVIKLNCRKISGVWLVTKSKSMVIEFVFCHEGFNSLKKRIKFKAFPYNNLNKRIKHKLIEIDSETLVLVNTDNESHAITYIIKADDKKLSAEIKIYDYPQLGNGIINDEEKTGIVSKI